MKKAFNVAAISFPPDRRLRDIPATFRIRPIAFPPDRRLREQVAYYRPL